MNQAGRPSRWPYVQILILLIVTFILTTLPSYGQTTGASQTSPPPSSGIVPVPPTGQRQGKPRFSQLSTALDQLLADWQVARDKAREEAQTRGLELEHERVKVMLMMLDEASAEAAVAEISKLGGEVTAHYSTWIDAWVPVAALADLAALPGVTLVREPASVFPVDGIVPTTPRAVERNSHRLSIL